MARKDGTPRVTPDLSLEETAAALAVGDDPRDSTVIAETDDYKIVAFHIYGKRFVTVYPIRAGIILLTEDETDAFAQHMLDAREELRR